MEKKIEKILVAFYNSTAGGLKVGIWDELKSLKHNKDYKVILLEYALSCGNISNVPFSNAEIYEDLYFTATNDIYKSIQSSIKTISSYSKKATIELFVNLKRANEVCNLYYFIDKFKDMDNVFLNYYHEERIEVFYKNIGNVLDTKIVVDKKEPLTKDIASTFTEKWQQLVLNNKAVREFCDGELKEFTLEEAKEKILPVFRNRFRRFPKLYNDFIEKCDVDKTFSFNYIIFEYISKKLLESGVLERTYNTDVPSGCADIYYEQKFRLAPKRESHAKKR